MSSTSAESAPAPSAPDLRAADRFSYLDLTQLEAEADRCHRQFSAAEIDSLSRALRQSRFQALHVHDESWDVADVLSTVKLWRAGLA